MAVRQGPVLARRGCVGSSVTTAIQLESGVRPGAVPLSAARVAADGKFLRDGDSRFLVKGRHVRHVCARRDGVPVSTASPDCRRLPPDGGARHQHRPGLHAAPPRSARRGGAPRSARHGRTALVAARRVSRRPSRSGARSAASILTLVNELGDHPAVLMFALGNEIPPGVVRWHGRLRIEQFLRDLYHDAKAVVAREPASPTSTSRRPSFSICRSSTSARSTSTCTASPTCAPISRDCSTSPDTSRCSLAEAGADSIREGEEGQAAITSMHIRAAFEEGACGAVAFAWTDEWWRGGHPVDDWAFGLVDRARRPKPAAAAVAATFADAPFPARPRAASGRKVSVVVCAYNAADTHRGLPVVARAVDVSRLRDHPRQRRLDAIAPARSPARHGQVRVIDIPNGGLSAARNVGLSEASGRDRRVHGRRCTRRSRLADLPRPAVPDLGRRRLGRAERRARRRSTDGAVHRTRTGRPDARAARRPHRGARARLQHGVPPRARSSAIGGFNPDLPSRRRRRGRLLAAAGARLADRLRVVRARLAPPSIVGEGVLAAAGRLRRGRALADGAPPGQVPRRAHAVARPHLQPAAVRAIALGHAHQRGRLGHGGLSVGLSNRRPSVRVPARIRSDGRSSRSS